METTQTQFANGDFVRVVRCDNCEKLVGKVATIKSVEENGRVRLSFGRGRPCKGQPEFFDVNDLEGVSNEQEQNEQPSE